MKLKTATITFHSSHNYGSMLQAYALQQTLKHLGYDNEIINLRTERQTRLYDGFVNIPLTDVKAVLKRLFILPYRKALVEKYRLYEKFLSEDLHLTKEYHTLEELEKEDFKYDCYISGGDQIWNTAPLDFDWSFYLPFVKKGKRISYAVSMGPKAEQQVTNRDRVKHLLEQYNHISVREEGTKALVETLVNTPVSIELDPALLLTGEQWFNIVKPSPLIKGDYILLYSPGYNKQVYDMARYLSKKLGMKVVVTIFSKKTYSYPFVNHLATGPWEFLNLVAHAKLVVSGSFHALVFATLFHTPFFAVNGDKDNRMITFLKNMQLLDRTINMEDKELKSKSAFESDFTAADRYLSTMREASLSYLKNAIEN